MGKTAQRKRTLYNEGRRDGKAGRGILWIRHPQLDSYLEGYHMGRMERQLDNAGLTHLVKFLELFNPTPTKSEIRRSRGKGRGHPEFYPRKI